MRFPKGEMIEKRCYKKRMVCLGSKGGKEGMVIKVEENRKARVVVGRERSRKRQQYTGNFSSLGA